MTMTQAKSGLQTYCKPCNIAKDNANPELRSARYVRYKTRWPGRPTWSFIRKRAQRLGVPMLPMEDFTVWFDKQPRQCVYCSMEEVDAKKKFGRGLGIDRKECSLGYVEGNMALACFRCNTVKNAYLSYDQMMQVAGMFFGGPVNNHDALVAALQFIADGYANQDVNHVDYRVKVYQVALDMLEKAST